MGNWEDNHRNLKEATWNLNETLSKQKNIVIWTQNVQEQKLFKTKKGSWKGISVSGKSLQLLHMFRSCKTKFKWDRTIIPWTGAENWIWKQRKTIWKYKWKSMGAGNKGWWKTPQWIMEKMKRGMKSTSSENLRWRAFEKMNEKLNQIKGKRNGKEGKIVGKQREMEHYGKLKGKGVKENKNLKQTEGSRDGK